MDNEDNKIKQFITKDKTVSAKANNIFDNFIEKIKNDEVFEEQTNTGQTNNTQTYNRPNYFFRFRKLIAVAASLVIVIGVSNAYAQSQGYDNIFFLIKDKITSEEKVEEEIFSDRDIVISYKSIQITNDVDLQINELKIKDNKAKLYLLVKQAKEITEAPLYYKVYNEEGQTMYDAISSKKENEKRYTEVLNLNNYKDDTNIIKMEVFNNDKVLLKTITIDLLNKTIEARTENQVVKQISQIELNEFIKQEMIKTKKNELVKQEVIVINTYDIYYDNGKYVAKFLYMTPSEEEVKNDKVEESTIYMNTIEFKVDGGEFVKLKLDKEEIF